MPIYQKKDNNSHSVIHDRVVQAIFAATESVGITDRRLAEELTQQVIQRLDDGQMTTRLPLPGMEEFVSQGNAAQSKVESIVEEALDEMGHHKIAQAYRSLNNDSPRKKERKSRTLVTQKPSQKQDQCSTLELSPNAMRVLEKRYLAKDSQGNPIETPEQMFRRVAHHVASAELQYDPEATVDYWEEEFYRAMANLEFLPNSPTLMNAGRELGQLSACFVLPVEDSMESIFDAVKHTALIHKSGGGTGFSFNRLRPENDRVGSTGGVASGPVSFIRAFDTATDVIKQGGMRRGANMAILNVDHPDIMKFITAKEESGTFTNFNFSVAITDDFMQAVEKGTHYDLINPHTGLPTQQLEAREVFDTVVDMAWKTGDPGIIFLDRVNADNPVPHLGNIESTNPCGEQPLLPYESCNLGSINLSKLVNSDQGRKSIDYERLRGIVKLAVQFLDDVIDVNNFPLPEIEQMTKTTRKIGLGIMGFADMLIQMDIPYDSLEAINTAHEVMRFIDEEALCASEELAITRGTFPAFEGSIYNAPGGKLVRNAVRSTIAPTGSLSIIANCSSGIEPLFAISYVRTILEGENLIEVNSYFEKAAKEGGFYSEELVKDLAQYGTAKGMQQVPEDVQRVFVTAHDITPQWHVRMQGAFQKHTDNAVSKTVNFPTHATRDDVAEVFQLAFKEKCKGITIYRDKSKDAQVLSFGKDKEQEKAQKVSHEPRKRPRSTTGFTDRVSTGCGHIYVTVNRDERGICEVFSTLGKAGGCASAQLQATSRLISLALRSGVDTASVARNLRGIRCPSIAWEQGHSILSCPDAIGTVLETQVETTEEDDDEPANIMLGASGQCPECGGLLTYQEGCHLCLGCGYTRCG